MKRILVFFLFVFMLSCENEIQKPEKNLEEILQDKQVAVYKGILTFKDENTFNSMSSELSKKDTKSILDRCKSLNFISAFSIYEDVIAAEETFLSEMVKKYGEASTVTRDQMGYSKLTQAALDKGTIYIDEDGLLAINVMVPMMAPLVNENGIVRVGDELRQYKRDSYKVIRTPDYDGLKNLDAIRESTSTVYVSPVQRQRAEVPEFARSKALSKCENVNGSHRIIGYEEQTVNNDGGTPCPYYRTNYYVQIRSLKKVLGSWQNFNSGQLGLVANYCLDHKNCDGTINRTIVCRTDHDWSGGYGHTLNYPLVENYDIGPCNSSTSNCYGIGSMVFQPNALRKHTVRGPNSTTCSMP